MLPFLFKGRVMNADSYNDTLWNVLFPSDWRRSCWPMRALAYVQGHAGRRGGGRTDDVSSALLIPLHGWTSIISPQVTRLRCKNMGRHNRTGPFRFPSRKGSD